MLAAAGSRPQRAWDSFFPVDGTDGRHGPAASRREQLYDIVFYIGAAIFVIVEVLIVYTVFRYRRKPGDESLPPQTHGNNLVEVIWTAIPTAIVLFLFVLSWQTLNTVEAKTPTEVHVRAVAARFQWQFDYLDANGDELFTQALPVGEDGGMVLPVGEPVHVTLRSPDVIHAFYVPKFLFKRDVVPGKENTFDFTVEEPGTYRGQCAELCGTFHGSMLFDVHALPQAEYDAWLAGAIEKANATPAPAAVRRGRRARSSRPPPRTSRSPRTELTAPADTPFTIHFKNEDAAGVPAQRRDQGRRGRRRSSRATSSTAARRSTTPVPALAAGSYPFVCTVHPNMTGTLTVQ